MAAGGWTVTGCWPHWRYDTAVPGLPKDLRTAFVPIFTRLAAEGPTRHSERRRCYDRT